MKSRALTTAVAMFLALTATLAVFLYVRGVEKESESAATMTTVIVAKQDIPAGTDLDPLLTEGAFETRSIDQEGLVPGAITALSELEGEETSAAILQGEQITQARLQGSGELPGGALGIPPGHQALTLAVNAPQGAGGALRSNENVMIYATFDKAPPTNEAATVTLVANVEILKVTSNVASSADPQGTDEFLVTMALKPRDAQKVVFAHEEGTVYFGLQAPGEESSQASPIRIGEVVR